MKILKKGREQIGWSRECKCTGSGNGGGGCGAVLLVEEDDVFQTQSNALHETDYYWTFKCAGCSVLTDIPAPPRRVQDKALQHPLTKTNGR